MNPIWANVAALAIAVIYYLWRASEEVRLRRERTLRARATRHEHELSSLACHLSLFAFFG